MGNGQRRSAQGMRYTRGRQVPYADVGMTAGVCGGQMMAAGQQPMMVASQQPVMVAGQQPVMLRGSCPHISGGLVKGPIPMAVAQPQMMMVQQPRMVVQQPGVQIRDIQVSPLVTERHIVQQTKKIIRKTRKPVTKQVGTRMVDTFETLEVKNPSTMRMSTEYAEPYIKRDGYIQENCGVIGQTTTKVIHRGQSVARQVTVPVVTAQVTPAPGMTRGYTRIDTWKHCGDGKRHL